MTDDPTAAVLERLDAGGYGVQDKRGYWMARCPGHDDRQASLSIRRGEDGKCLLNCFVCGKGTAEAVTRALDMPLSDLFVPSLNGNGRAPISVAALAKAKGFTADYLRGLGLSEGELYGAPAVLIPYRLGDGSLAPVTRARTGVSGRQSKWRRGDALMPYGLERLEGWRSQGALILVEGESDCWALWGADLPALGLPGAQSAKCLAAEHVAGFSRLYVVREPDEGGKAFVAGVAERLAELGWTGSIKVAQMPPGIKDPCELRQANPGGFRERMLSVLRAASPIEPEMERKPKTAARVLDLMDAAELMATVYPPLIENVKGVLPEGHLLLAGRPKGGKSWLALGIALALSMGGVALGTIPVERGQVLYLALEDGKRRLQRRLQLLLGDTPIPPGWMTISTTWTRLEAGGLGDIADWLATHPQAKLVVIDTFTRVRAPDTPRGSLYLQDYNNLSPLTDLAQTRPGLTILTVVHTKKGEADNPMDLISGSTGMQGAPDGALVLKRPHKSAEGTLDIGHRDAGEVTLSLKLDAANQGWTLLGELDDEHALSEERRSILVAIRAAGKPLGPKAISQATGHEYNATRFLLHQMEDDGQIKRFGRGLYLAPEMASTTANNANNANNGDEGGADGEGNVSDRGPNVSGVAGTANIRGADSERGRASNRPIVSDVSDVSGTGRVIRPPWWVDEPAEEIVSGNVSDDPQGANNDDAEKDRW